MKKLLGCLFPPVIIVLALAFFVGSSAKLSCKKLEINYTKCQLQRFRMFGLISTSVESFRLTKAKAETHIDEHSDGDSTIYKLVLYEKDVPIQFYQHGEFIFLGNDAQSDNEKINTFLRIENENVMLNIYSRSYVKIAKALIDEKIILIMFLIVITIFSKISSAFKRRKFE
ncbi:hypothetical protein IQ247_03695 [Plectonema cf. radiosum LEGE 06105]|uniref:Uncharacterized protein n=1 Tax=Plectonema cf. radiosum LEGE 06105 TaxID=945769 RepID=A0A8J7JRX4_9CYAN|nr:hypothetical protein [Plectonema radiosum]MBE9211829.1 hypothetical protein [Plectonema cf. radiosum LEGE 06105]